MTKWVVVALATLPLNLMLVAATHISLGHRNLPCRQSAIGIASDKSFSGALIALELLSLPPTACEPFALPKDIELRLDGQPWIALAQRGNCSFVDKLKALKLSGCSGAIVGEVDVKQKLLTMVSPPGEDDQIDIPSVFIKRKDYDELLEAARSLSGGIAPNETHSPLDLVYTAMNNIYFWYWSILRIFVDFVGSFDTTDLSSDTPPLVSSNEQPTEFIHVEIIQSNIYYSLYVIVIFLLSPLMATLSAYLLHVIGQWKRKWDNMAAKREVLLLPSRMWKALEASDSHEAEVSCPICLDEYQVTDSLRILPCKHEFHAKCVDQWLTTVVNTCPLCKQSISKPKALPVTVMMPDDTIPPHPLLEYLTEDIGSETSQLEYADDSTTQENLVPIPEVASPVSKRELIFGIRRRKAGTSANDEGNYPDGNHNQDSDTEEMFDDYDGILRVGEILVGCFDRIEDGKGATKDVGSLFITTLRIIWKSLSNKRSNLSIGLSCIQSLSSSVSESLARGSSSSLHLSAKFENLKFEFVFSGESPDFVLLATRVQQSYEETKIYRDLKVKSSIIAKSELELLEYEIIVAQLDGVLNVSNDKGIIGRMVFTNIRTVWFSIMSDSSNVSIPHLQVEHIQVQNSKYGKALCITTYQTHILTSYRLGFQVPSEPIGKLKEMALLIKDLIKAYMEAPIFGVQFEDSIDQKLVQTSNTRQDSQDTITGEENEQDGLDISSSEYPPLLFSSTKRGSRLEPEEFEFVVDERLGLTVARGKGSNLTSGDLWKLF
ncbi:hypothetical protein BDR26DRAFT_933138 [Obelidium mucronatum]|nr:hypothetical protein BDR26DRAFT_933138 [Obelidium mucronatum]